MPTSKRVTNHFKGLLAGHGSTRKAGKMRLRLNGNSAVGQAGWLSPVSSLPKSLEISRNLAKAVIDRSYSGCRLGKAITTTIITTTTTTTTMMIPATATMINMIMINVIIMIE